jgi:hypothetical protein
MWKPRVQHIFFFGILLELRRIVYLTNEEPIDEERAGL